MQGDLERIWVGETLTEGRTVGHCEKMKGRGRVMGWFGRLGDGDSWL